MVELRIIGTELPGRSCGESYANVHVGLQVRRDPDQVVPADTPRVTFSTPIEIVGGPHGPDFKGPAVQGRPGDRFVYLTWGDVGADGEFAMFRRAKLMLDAVDADTAAAARTAGVLTAELGLTADDGMPRCAAVRPPAVTWTA